jgi:hypothetical protein
MEGDASGRERLAPLRHAFGSLKDPLALVRRAQQVAATRLPAHVAGDTAALLAPKLVAARKEQSAQHAAAERSRVRRLDPHARSQLW